MADSNVRLGRLARQHFGSWTYPPDVEQGGTTAAWVSGWNHFFSWKTISHAPDPSTSTVRIHRRTMMMMSSAHKSFHTRSLLNCISSCRLNWTALLKEPIVDFGVIPEDDSLLNHSSSHSGEFALWFSVIWKSYDGKMLFINRMISVFFPSLRTTRQHAKRPRRQSVKHISSRLLVDLQGHQHVKCFTFTSATETESFIRRKRFTSISGRKAQSWQSSWPSNFSFTSPLIITKVSIFVRLQK